MHSNNKYNGINPDVISIIRRKAHQLIKHKYFSEADFQDLEQELMIDLSIKIDVYEPEVSSLYGFVKKIVENKAKDLIRNLSCKKRDYKNSIRSIYEAIDNDENYLLIEDIAANASFYDHSTSDFEEYIEMELDIHQLVERLSDNQRRLYQLLQSMSVDEIIETTGMSRRTFYRILKKLRQNFINSEFFK